MISNLFSRELEILKNGREFLSRVHEERDLLSDNFEKLLNEYEKLLGQTQKLVRISDMVQLKLDNMAAELQTENECRRKAEAEKELVIADLKDAMAQVKQLRGLLPICSFCKKIRDDKGYWQHIESYIRDHSDADFTHSICPQCVEKYYPDIVAGNYGKEEG